MISLEQDTVDRLEPLEHMDWARGHWDATARGYYPCTASYARELRRYFREHGKFPPRWWKPERDERAKLWTPEEVERG